ncbi:MAG: glycosyltransferase family 87 protein [Terracidiphilus sp.]
MAITNEIPAEIVKRDYAEIIIAGVTGLTLAFAAIFLCVVPITNIAGARDFVVFWATGQQIVHHGNPYDANAMMSVERAAGLPPQDGAMFMRNLPWGLPLAYPLGFIGLRPAALLWSLALLACLLLSVRSIRRMHGCPDNYLHWLGVSFAPALLCLMMGQTSLFALMGYVSFLALHQRRPFAAGASLWLCALKPHLFLPFGIVLLAWIVVSKSYKVLAGAAFALATSCAALSLLYPAAWREYTQMMRMAGIESAHIPCISVALRFWLWPQSLAFTYLPAAMACTWAIVYFYSRRQSWDWVANGSLILLVSLLAAPYSWVYDDCIAIPALLHGAYITKSRILLAVAACASVIIEAELLTGVEIQTYFYLWTAPTWLLWYVAATHIKEIKSRDEQIAIPVSAS